MTIQTKFKIKDEVFTLAQNKVEKGTISFIEIRVNQSEITIKNHIHLDTNDPHNKYVERGDDFIFATKQELLNSL
jgi:hypothetical protein